MAEIQAVDSNSHAEETRRAAEGSRQNRVENNRDEEKRSAEASKKSEEQKQESKNLESGTRTPIDLLA